MKLAVRELVDMVNELEETLRCLSSSRETYSADLKKFRKALTEFRVNKSFFNKDVADTIEDLLVDVCDDLSKSIEDIDVYKDILLKKYNKRVDNVEDEEC